MPIVSARVGLRDALQRQGLRVWMDDGEIETFESITAAIVSGLAHCRVLVAVYSLAYPRRRACQWELTAAFVAAQRSGRDPRERVLVVNPESDAAHIDPVELRDALFAAVPADGDDVALDALASEVAVRVGRVDGLLGELGVGVGVSWLGRKPVAAAQFVGRARELWAVHSALRAGDVGLITGARGDPALKVSGMGGIGKSLLAHEYALRFGSAYPGGVFWLRAHGYDDRGDGMDAVGREADRGAQLRLFADAYAVPTADRSVEEIAAALGGVLDARGLEVLWIVDDLPGGLDSDALEAWCAPAACARTLMTTRSRDYERIGAHLDLAVLDAREGYELLTGRRSPVDVEEQRAARAIVDALGRHALAIDVAAGALAAERGLRTFAAYLDALADSGADELEVAAQLAGELPGGHEASIATTLARSIREVDEHARDVLRLGSLLAVEPIAPQLLVDVLARVDGLDTDTARRRAVRAISDATRRSLAERADRDACQIHTLISRTMRLVDEDTQRTAALAAATAAVLHARTHDANARRVPLDPTTLAHAQHLATLPASDRDARLLNEVAVQHHYRGDSRAARALFEEVYATWRRVLGDEHPDTLTSANNLAETRRAQGDHAGARALHEEVYATRRRVLGDEHPDTLTSANNLAETRYAQGDHAGARALLEEVYATRRRVLGDEHPDTLTSANNLAETRYAQGDHAGARALHEEVYATRRRVLGDEHPDTLTSANNLAETRYAQGDHAGARALHEEVYATRRRVLGNEHPSTLNSANNLAATRYAQGDHAGARALLEEVYATRRRVLGDEHPDTLTSANNLAVTRQALDDAGV